MCIVTCVDYGETADGHSRYLGSFKDKEEASNYIHEDMKDTIHSYGGDGMVIDENKFEVWADASKTNGCVWDIFEVK